MYLLDLNGEVLFTGTRHEAKMFLRKNRINRYRLVERLVEKVAEFKADDETDNNLAKPATKEGFFNRVFGDEDE